VHELAGRVLHRLGGFVPAAGGVLQTAGLEKQRGAPRRAQQQLRALVVAARADALGGDDAVADQLAAHEGCQRGADLHPQSHLVAQTLAQPLDLGLAEHRTAVVAVQPVLQAQRARPFGAELAAAVASLRLR
jgi:hypothetical protein